VICCPYCRESLAHDPPGSEPPEEPRRRLMACTVCRTRVHAPCAQAHGGCVTYGCDNTHFSFVTTRSDPERRSGPRAPRRTPRRVRDERRRERAAAAPPEPEPGWVPGEDLPLFALAALGLAGILLFG
jgi:hypothetical protein